MNSMAGVALFIGEAGMLRVIVKSGIVTLAVILVGQVISYSGRVATGREFTFYVFVMNNLLPLVTAFPASLLIFWQQHRLQSAHAALAEAHAALSHKAAHDGLTGMLNRETFLARIPAAGGFLLIDADYFKAINDTYGHSEGDAALRLIAGAVKATVGNGSIVGRLGGEEFGVFLPSASSPEAIQMAERIRAAVADVQYYPLHGRRHELSVSIGVAVAGNDVDFPQTFRHADANLYEAKAAGRNAVVASSSPPRLAAVSF